MFCVVLPYSQNVVSGMAVEKARRRVDEEREQHLVRFGEIEGALQGAPGGVRIANARPGRSSPARSLPPPRPGMPRDVRERHRYGRGRPVALCQGGLAKTSLISLLRRIALTACHSRALSRRNH
jgi:hypothetical protein